MLPQSNARPVQRVPVNSLRPALHPSRRHPTKQLSKVRKSLAAFGQVRPILVTPDGEIIDLELVWLALKANGAEYADVMVVNDLAPHELKALRLALNRTALDGKWDEPSVRSVLDQLVEVDFDLEVTGFDALEIEHFFNLDEPEAEVQEEMPAAGGALLSAPDDIWCLGDHRVGCGSATDQAFVGRVLNGRLANVCFVDPLCNMMNGAFASVAGSQSQWKLVAGVVGPSANELFTLLRDSLLVLKANCVPTGLVYACIDWRHVTEMTVAGRSCGMPLQNICVWTNAQGDRNGWYRNHHEFVRVFNTEIGASSNKGARGPRRKRSDVWTYSAPTRSAKQADGRAEIRPKPIAMVADILRDVTERRGVILDSFLGSGTTLMAAEKTGRICCGVEGDPLYVDVAIRRWQQATGRQAILVQTGQTFSARAKPQLMAPPESAHDE